MRMTVITKSYAPDFKSCADLHRAVLDCTPESVHHHIIVPQQDLKLFDRLPGSRTHENGAMVEPVRHRRTKGAATDMLEPKATASPLDSTPSLVIRCKADFLPSMFVALPFGNMVNLG